MKRPFQIVFFFLISISVFSQKEDCLKITVDKSIMDSTNSSFEYVLEGFGQIPIDTIYHQYQNNNPFTIKNNCFLFCISHMGCDFSYKLLWKGEYRIDSLNRTIADIKFILKWKTPCKRNNHECLKYDIEQILNGYSGKDLYLNFIGYNKLLKIK